MYEACINVFFDRVFFFFMSSWLYSIAFLASSFPFLHKSSLMPFHKMTSVLYNFMAL